MNNFSQDLENDKYPDLILISREGMELTSHRTVLSACSPYFNSLLLDHPGSGAVILMPDFEHEILQILLNFIYTGKSEVRSNLLDSVLSSFKELKVKGYDVFAGNGDEEEPREDLLHIDFNYIEDESLCPRGVPEVADRETKELVRKARGKRWQWTRMREALLKQVMLTNDGKFADTLQKTLTQTKRRRLWQNIHQLYCEIIPHLPEPNVARNHNEIPEKRDIRKKWHYILKKGNVDEDESLKKIIIEYIDIDHTYRKMTHANKARCKRKCPEKTEFLSQKIFTADESGEKLANVVQDIETDHCSYFKSKDKFKDLIEAKNEMKKKYFCESCGKQFTNKPCLNKHKRSSHGEKFVCPICSKSTVHGAKRLHMRLHLPEEERLKFYCSKCEYKTTNKGHLKEHFQSKHEGLKYFCKLCNAEYNYEGGRRNHIQRVHKGKRWKCEICDHSTTQAHHLKAHMKKHSHNT